MTFDEERAADARNEARQDEAAENECPCCGSQLTHSRYRDDGQTVEQGVSCDCGYASGTSYGMNYLDLPDGWRENEQGEIVNEDDEIVLEDEE